MKIAIMQPYIFPYMGYFQLYNAVDLFISLEDVNFTKGGWINRNKIMIEGQPSYITFPIRNISQNRYINQHYINWDEPWPRNLLKKIKYAYGKETYFKEVYPEIEILFNRRGEDCVASFAMVVLAHIGDCLGIKTKLEWSLRYVKTGLSGQDRLIDICKQTKADIYVNAIGGKDLYTADVFKPTKLKFIQRTDNENNLSIIDILMRRGWKETSKLINQYELIE